jgi:hypothetical protein
MRPELVAPMRRFSRHVSHLGGFLVLLGSGWIAFEYWNHGTTHPDVMRTGLMITSLGLGVLTGNGYVRRVSPIGTGPRMFLEDVKTAYRTPLARELAGSHVSSERQR